MHGGATNDPDATDPARAVRDALLRDAHASATRLRILCCIPFSYRPARLPQLLAALRGLGGLAVRALDIHLLTDTAAPAAHATLHRLGAAVLPAARLTVHARTGLADPWLLTWAHKPFITERFLAPGSGYDLFLYIEDDILFGPQNLAYWLAARPALEAFGLIPSFVRYEYNDRDQSLYATDLCYPAAIEAKEILRFGDWLFVRPDFPFDALYLLDRPLAERHVRAPSFDPERSRAVVDWSVPERAGLGPRYDGRPPGTGANSAIAIDARGLIPAPSCCVHHLTDTYVHVPGPHAKLRLDRVFYRESDPAAEKPAAAALRRGSLRAAIAAVEPARHAQGIVGSGTIHPAGSYRRAPPMLIDTTGLDAAERAICTRDLGRGTEHHAAIFIAELSHPFLAGEGSVVTADGMLVEESCWEFFAQKRLPPGLVETADGALGLADGPRRHIARAALLLKRPFQRNYGHWLLDAAIPLALAAEERLLDDVAVIVGADDGAAPDLTGVIEDSLRRLAPRVPVLRHPDGEIWRIDKLRYLAPLGVTPLFRLPAGIATLRAAFAVDRPVGPRRRLFVARDDTPRRRLENEAELFALLADFGFERVGPERLKLAEQAALFASAEVVVGVKGAALTNILFCQPGTKVIVLSPGEWREPLFWDLAAQLGCPYLEVFGPMTARDLPVSHNPFRIAPDGLRRALLAALPAPRAGVAAPPAGMAPGPAAPMARPAAPAAGPAMLAALARLHQQLAPARYVEIGTGTDRTLAVSRCASLAVAPDFVIERDLAATIPLLLLFEMSVAAFFRDRDPAALLGGPVDLGLIAGNEGQAGLLRDFALLEPHLRPGGTVVLDLGGGAGAAEDAAVLGARLCAHRPGLEISALATPPSVLLVARLPEAGAPARAGGTSGGG